MTLTEFLLARIAEDEEVANRSIQIGSKGIQLLHIGTPDAPLTMIVHPHRVLAECDAKRRIVEDFEALHADYRVTHDPSTEARRLQARIAMAHLSTIYADHPDWREEWKP